MRFAFHAVVPPRLVSLSDGCLSQHYVSETENAGNISVSRLSLGPYVLFLCSETENSAILSVSLHPSLHLPLQVWSYRYRTSPI